VAVSIITFMLALTGKLMVKDRLARQGAPGFAAPGRAHGRGLVARCWALSAWATSGRDVPPGAPFDMRFIAHDPYADKAVAAELGIELVSIEELFARADVLTVNCPLNPATHHIVNAERLGLMKATAYFINTARGPIVDQKALTAALAGRPDRGAGLDACSSRNRPTPTTRSSSSTM